MSRVGLLLLAVASLALVGFMPTASPKAWPMSGPLIPFQQDVATNWSGYTIETNLEAPQNSAVTDVKGQWVVPDVTCSMATAYSAVWVGLDGYSNGNVEQIGTEQDCYGGKAFYCAWYEMYPKPGWRISYPISAGDVMTAEVKYIGGSKFTLTLTDATRGWSFTTTETGKGQRQSAEWIVEAPWSGGVLPLANFGTAQFRDAAATVNHRTGTISDAYWQDDARTMVVSDTDPTVKAQPSGLGAEGSSFSVTWEHQ